MDEKDLKDQEIKVDRVGYTMSTPDAFASRTVLEAPSSPSLGQHASQFEVANLLIDLDKIVDAYFQTPAIINSLDRVYDELAANFYATNDLVESMKTSIITGLKTHLKDSVETCSILTEWWFGQDANKLIDNVNIKHIKPLYDGRTVADMSALFKYSYGDIPNDSNGMMDASVTANEWESDFINKAINSNLPISFAKWIYSIGGFVYDFGNGLGARRRVQAKFHFKVNGHTICKDYRTKATATARLATLYNERASITSTKPLIGAMLKYFGFEPMLITVSIPGTDSYIINYREGLNFSRSKNSTTLHIQYMADQSLRDMINDAMEYNGTGTTNGYRDDLMPLHTLKSFVVQSQYLDGSFNGDVVSLNALYLGFFESFRLYLHNALEPLNITIDDFSINLTTHTETSSIIKLLPYDVRLRPSIGVSWLNSKIQSTSTLAQLETLKVNGDDVEDHYLNQVDELFEMDKFTKYLSWNRPVGYAQQEDGHTNIAALNIGQVAFADVVVPDQVTISDQTAYLINRNAAADIFKYGANTLNFPVVKFAENTNDKANDIDNNDKKKKDNKNNKKDKRNNNNKSSNNSNNKGNKQSNNNNSRNNQSNSQNNSNNKQNNNNQNKSSSSDDKDVNKQAK